MNTTTLKDYYSLKINSYSILINVTLYCFYPKCSRKFQLVDISNQTAIGRL